MARRGVKVAAAVVGVAAVVLAGLLLMEFDATGLDLTYISNDEIIWRPNWQPNTPEAILAEFDAATAQPAWTVDGNLIRSRKPEDRLVLHRPHIQLVETAGSSSRASAPVAAGPAATAGALSRLALRISRIDVEDGTIELQAAGAPRPVVVKGLDLRLRDVSLDPSPGAALAGLGGVGDVKVAEVTFTNTHARDLRGTVRLSNGRLQTDTVRFRTEEGAFEAAFAADLSRLPLAYTLSLRGQPLDVARIMGSSAAKGFGPGSLRVDARGVGPEADGISGAGTFRLEAGTLEATPVLKALEQALGRTSLVGARYQATQTPFRIDRGRVLFDGLRLQTDHVGVQVGGWASMHGPLELSVSIRAPRPGVSVGGLASSALDLVTDQDGSVVIPFKVTGTQTQPRVAPDLAALATQTKQGAARSLIERAGRELGGLLSRKPREPR